MLITSVLQEKRYNIAGPLCFSGDVVKYNALLPEVCFHSIFSFMQLIKCNAFSFTYIEDITRLGEDMDFMFEWQEQYLTSERSERVRYCSCHENI